MSHTQGPVVPLSAPGAPDRPGRDRSATCTCARPTSTACATSTSACSASTSSPRRATCPGWGTTGDILFLSAGGYHHHLGFNTWKSAGGAAAARRRHRACTTSRCATRRAPALADAAVPPARGRLADPPARRPRHAPGDLHHRPRRQRPRADVGPAVRRVAARRRGPRRGRRSASLRPRRADRRRGLSGVSRCAGRAPSPDAGRRRSGRSSRPSSAVASTTVRSSTASTAGRTVPTSISTRTSPGLLAGERVVGQVLEQRPEHVGEHHPGPQHLLDEGLDVVGRARWRHACL